MNETKINWTEHTWNPASGCSRVSKACERCYAETIAENKRGTASFPKGFDVMMRPWKLEEPRRIHRPSLIFTNSMTDMFHADITDDYRDKICDVMRRYPQHRYQVLTKRTARAEKYFRTRKVPDSMWMGTTVEYDETFWRIDCLRRIDAPVRFLSCEPMYSDYIAVHLEGIHWVIGGGESGSHLASSAEDLAERALVRRGSRSEARWVPREDRIGWVRHLRDAAKGAGAAFWWKQWGGPRPESGGRILDGRTWDEMPTHIANAMPSADYVHREAATKQRTLPLLS